MRVTSFASTDPPRQTHPDEYYFGGGMQNGRFSHKGHRIRISTDYNWADGGNPNSAPFYMSSAGYGVYRNTWYTSACAICSRNGVVVTIIWVQVPRVLRVLGPCCCRDGAQ